MHPKFTIVKKELNKSVTSKIIFPVCHTQSGFNLVPIRKKNEKIQLCVNFRNLNRASDKDNYLIPPMEQIL
jgi:hypothetical protein